MTLKSRLGRLEPSAKEAHAAAWRQFWILHDRHSTPILVLLRDRALFAKAVHMNDTELETFWADSSGLMQHDDLGLWGLAYDRICPEHGTVPELPLWPHAFPTPPAEPPELWNRLETLTKDPDPNRRVCAVMTLLVLASARAVSDFKGGYNRERE